jgi:hypothetical protein
MGTYNGEPIVTIYDLLDIVRERPGMWLGSPNIEYLFVWIQGVHAGAHVAGDPLTGGAPDFHGFHGWIAARTGRAESTGAGQRCCSMHVAATPSVRSSDSGSS